MVKISDFANVKYCSYALFCAESARFLKKWLLVIKIFVTLEVSTTYMSH